MFVTPTPAFCQPPGDLKEQLAEKPINQKSWSEWSPKLRAWSGKDFAAAEPAFRQAFDYVRGESSAGKGAALNLPKNLAKDAVAWMVLAGALLEPSDEPPVPRAKSAFAAADQSTRIDKTLARAHFYRCLAIRKEQTTPLSQGGPAKVDTRRLGDALTSLKQARELAPDAAWLSLTESGQLAAAALLWVDAESFFQLALDKEPGNVDIARQLTHAINKNSHKEPYASLTEPIAKRFDKDGIVIVQYAWSLARDNRLEDAFRQLTEARKLGVDDPAKYIDIAAVRSIEKDNAARLNRLKEEAKKKEDAASRKEELARQREQEEARRKEESAKAEIRRKEDAAAAEKRRQEDLANQQARQKVEDQRRQTDAERLKAQALGQQQSIDAFHELLWIIAWWAIGFTATYACIIGSMSLGGLLLAKKTRGMSAAEMFGDDDEEDDDDNGKQAFRAPREGVLARLYTFSLMMSLFFFYVALPFLFAGLLLLLTAFIVWKMKSKKSSGGDDVKVALIAASAGGIAAIFKALFASSSGVILGVRKYADQCPILFETIEKVAQRVGIDPPDEVYVAPGATFSVYQKSRGPFGMFGGRKRVLVIGLCALNFLTVAEFKSILAHGFAKFSHIESWSHRFIYQVTLSLDVGVRELGRTGGWIATINPFYWFFWLYSRSYAMLSAGFSRTRQFLADRYAASLYGSDVFGRGLGKLITDGAHFESLIYGNISRMIRKNQAYVNMYLAFRKYRAETMTDDERLRLRHEFLEREPSLFDSHPTYQERLAAIEHLPPAKRKDKTKALELFEDAEAVEKELTDYLTGQLGGRR